MDTEADPTADNTEPIDITEIADDQSQNVPDVQNGSEDPNQAPESEALGQEEPEKTEKVKSILPPEIPENKDAVDGLQEQGNSAELATLKDDESVKEPEDVKEPMYVSGEDLKKKKKADRKLRIKEMEEKRFIISDDTSRRSFDAGDLEEERIADEEDDHAEFREMRKREEKLQARHTHLLEEDYEDAVLRDMEDDDYSDIDVEMSSISIQRRIDKGTDTVRLKEDFLNDFDLPSLSDYSEESLVHVKSLIKQESIIQAAVSDVGIFVDPLTGEVLSSTTSTSSEGTQRVEEEEAIEAEEEPVECPEMSDDDLPVPKLQGDQSLHDFDQFRQSYLTQSLGEKERDSDAEARTHRTELMIITQDFLKDLINALVNKSETINLDNLLRTRCDKSKLMEELITVTKNFYFEKLDNIFLQGRLVEYYKRSKNMRVFSQLDPEDARSYGTRYTASLDQVDFMRNRFITAKRKNSSLMNKVLLELHYTQTNASRSEAHLNQTVRHYLSLQDMEYLKRLTDRELRLMNVKRNEISDTRLVLITMKHTLGRLTEKINQLERVGDDLYINDFISIQNQVVTLDKKIEERNIELKKLRCKYHVDLHVIQHNREKALALAHKLQLCKASLEKLLDTQHAKREDLYRAKMDRTRLRKQQKEMSYQGGILSMPSLMYEYDNTVKGLLVKRTSVFKLRETLKNLNRRIQEYESISI
ncbi:uncharacterized protein LOC6590378 isoform X1 [Drosophila persimilis]|uniref:uncharacterized protein LOC6590378 isoform X1 n=1 Tax=Drosophila persimilis TaxID=7234 RepID=UPI000F086383|nr:uncharacterized protein LOC6590378 isoform X1 [Drosophila persimilis]